uniref:Uncharacterized protein n=1 Tax=Avena sativa TaxID=4498 RepID=A0ACD5WR77_AVESA
MAMQHLLLVVLMASVLLTVSSTTANLTVDAASATAYDILVQNNFPRGLLPLGVKSFQLHEGVLEVTFPGECNFFITLGADQFHFKYGSTVTAVIKPGSITKAHGVRVFVKSEFLGFEGVERAGDKLTFDLQGMQQSFPVSSFTQSPKCN